MSAGVVLAIETSQREGSVAIALPDEAGIDHEALRATSRHEDDLMPAIDRLCKRNDIAPRDITSLGVSIGPGGFTGLRIAVSTVKMLAESLDATIAAVPSALVLAESILDERAIAICLASKRDTTWLAHIERRNDHWHIVGTPGIVTADTFDFTRITLVVADEFLPAPIRSRIEQARCRIAHPILDARHCLTVAKRMLAAGTTIDSLNLAPIYARLPEAVQLWSTRNRA